MSSKPKAPHLRRPLVVAEVGNDWYKLVQFESGRRGLEITRLSLGKFETDDGSLPRKIGNAFRQQKFAKVPAIACIPRQMVTVRMLELPSTDPAEIADMVDLQVGKQTPYSKDEIASDYRIAGSSRVGYTRVMLAIVQRSVLRHHFNIMEEAGIEVDRMSISSEGLLNWATAATTAEGEATAVLDVDSFFSDFVVMVDGSLVFTRSILLGANQLLEDPDKWKAKLAAEVGTSLATFRGEAPEVSISRLVVTGAGVNIAGLSGYLGTETRLPAESVDSLGVVGNVPESPSLRDPEFHAVSLTAAVGTALGADALELNLVPDSVRLRRELTEKARGLTLFGILAMTALLSVSAIATLRFFLKQDQLQRIRARVSETGVEARELERMRQIVRLVDGRRDTRLAAISLMKEIHRSVPGPPRVSVDEITMDLERIDSQLRLAGSGESRIDVSTLIKNLEASPVFSDVKVDGSTSKDPASGRYGFRVVCTLEKAP